MQQVRKLKGEFIIRDAALTRTAHNVSATFPS